MFNIIKKMFSKKNKDTLFQNIKLLKFEWRGYIALTLCEGNSCVNVVLKYSVSIQKYLDEIMRVFFSLPKMLNSISNLSIIKILRKMLLLIWIPRESSNYPPQLHA
jgi:hypothetical protein